MPLMQRVVKASIAAIGLLVLVTAGCSGARESTDGQECVDDSACASGEICAPEGCRALCQADSHCDRGFECRASLCEPCDLGTLSERCNMVGGGRFATVVDASLATEYVSSELWVEGWVGDASAWIEGDGVIIVNGNESAGRQTHFVAGDSVRLAMLSSSLHGTKTELTLHLGNIKLLWGVVTGPDRNADTFEFVDVFDAELTSIHETNSITLAGYDGEMLVELRGPRDPELLVNGTRSGRSARVRAGDLLRIMGSAGHLVSTDSTFEVTLGGYRTTWTIETRAPTVCDGHNYSVGSILDARQFAVVFHDERKLYTCSMTAASDWMAAATCGSGHIPTVGEACEVSPTEYAAGTLRTYRCDGTTLQYAEDDTAWFDDLSGDGTPLTCFSLQSAAKSH